MYSITGNSMYVIRCLSDLAKKKFFSE